MNDPQSNRLDMYLIVQDLYIANQPVIDTVVARTTAFTQLKTNIVAINKEIAGQSTRAVGVAQDKSALRNTLNNTVMSVLSPARAWALSISNNTLAAEFDYTISEIQRIKDDTIEGFCTYRIALVNDNLAAMSDFGIGAPEVAPWQADLDAYTSIVETPREAINARHLHTQNLKTLFLQTAELFNTQLDPLMVVFKTSDPELYSAYKQARMIIDRGSNPGKPKPTTATATLFGVITNMAEGTAIVGAKIFTDPTATPILSGPDGSYSIGGLTTGERTVRIEADNFITFETSLTLEANAVYELNAQLQPSLPPVP